MFVFVSLPYPKFGFNCENCDIYAQDLAGDKSYRITEFACKEGNSIIISGELINYIGTSEQTKDDTSEPGMILKIK